MCGLAVVAIISLRLHHESLSLLALVSFISRLAKITDPERIPFRCLTGIRPSATFYTTGAPWSRQTKVNNAFQLMLKVRAGQISCPKLVPRRTCSGHLWDQYWLASGRRGLGWENWAQEISNLPSLCRLVHPSA